MFRGEHTAAGEAERAQGRQSQRRAVREEEDWRKVQTLREAPWEQERDKNAQLLEKASERRGKPKDQQVKGSGFSDKAVGDEAASCWLYACLLPDS